MTFNSALISAASLVSLTLAGCSGPQAKADGARASVQSKGQVYSFESDGNGFNTKNFFYDNGDEVVAFDTQFTPETARKSIEFLRTKTKNPISYVVITHPNPDKFNGMSVFQEHGAKVIASRATAESMKGVHDYKKYFFVNMAKMFTDETYPRLAQVDTVFDRAYELRLKNGETIQLSALSSPGVSSNQTVAMVPTAKALFVGDLIHHNAHAWLEGGIVNGQPMPTLRGWIKDLHELKVAYGEIQPMVYGGRGDAVPLDQAVSAQTQYLEKADELVSAYVRNLGARKAELSGDQASQHYAALQAEFEKAFPSYGLGYMIQYGVYGLVNSKK